MGRFAPSPTGRLHLGNARTAFLAWLQARAAGGSFLLRVEDLDRARCRATYLDDLFRDLEYLGLTWDEEPVFQSRRSEAYRAAIARLQQLGRTYECFCSRSEIARTASAPHDAADEGPRYPGTCANLGEAAAAERRGQRPPAVRFRPFAGVTHFTDRFCGGYEQDVEAAPALPRLKLEGARLRARSAVDRARRLPTGKKRGSVRDRRAAGGEGSARAGDRTSRFVERPGVRRGAGGSMGRPLLARSGSALADAGG